MKRNSEFFTVASALVFATALGPSVAQAQATMDPALVERLLRELEARDAMIARLEARVERLERQLPAQGRTAGPAETPPPVRTAPPPAAPAAASPAAAASAQGSQRAPTTLEVDPDAAERALERTLVVTGNLLLPPGRAELGPVFSYSHEESVTGGRLVPVDTNGDGIVDTTVLDTVSTRRDAFDAGVALRIGLPYDTQFEASLPLTYAREQRVGTVFRSASEDSGGGVGDLSLGLATTLVRESDWLPDIVGRVSWDTDFGREEADGVGIGSGFHEFGVSLNALKRQDPLAFTGSLFYEHSLEKNGVQPGDVYGLGVAAALAASPETSLRLGFSFAYRGETEVNGIALAGSETNQATLSLGVSTILGRNTLLNVNVGAGLTEDGPDYFVTLSMPVRFGVW